MLDQPDEESGVERQTRGVEGCEELECGKISGAEVNAGLRGVERVEGLRRWEVKLLG